MKYGPFDGIYFTSKTQFYKYVGTRIIHHRYRVLHRLIPLEFNSSLLADALFRHHPNFIDRDYSNNFGFIPIDYFGEKSRKHTFKLCVYIEDEWVPFAYKKILNNA